MGRIFPYPTKFGADARPRTRDLRGGLFGGVVVGLLWAVALPALADDAGVYRVTDRDGRQVYTNLAQQASHGRAAQQLDLPELSSIDFAREPIEALHELDARVLESHGALQAGTRCEAIRKSSRVPLRTRLWTDHGLKIYVSAALLGFAILLGYLGAKRRLGSFFPIAPFLGFAFLIYATVRDTRATFQALTVGLRACSEQLPDGESEDRDAIKNRLSKALDVRNSVNAAYDRQSALIESVMRER